MNDYTAKQGQYLAFIYYLEPFAKPRKMQGLLS